MRVLIYSDPPVDESVGSPSIVLGATVEPAVGA